MPWGAASPQTLRSAHGCFVRSGSLPFASETSEAMALVASVSSLLYGAGVAKGL